MDIVGPLPETKSGNLYILTIQSNFTKYSLAIPLPNHQANTIAYAFVKKFIRIFGSPKGVLTDQGRDFLSNLLKRLTKRFKIKQFCTTAIHPQSNGSLERSHPQITNCAYSASRTARTGADYTSRVRFHATQMRHHMRCISPFRSK